MLLQHFAEDAQQRNRSVVFWIMDMGFLPSNRYSTLSLTGLIIELSMRCMVQCTSTFSQRYHRDHLIFEMSRWLSRSQSRSHASSSRSSGISSNRVVTLQVAFSSRGADRELKHLAKKEFSISAFSRLVCAAVPASSVRVGIVDCYFLTYFTVLQNSFGFLGFSSLKYACLA